MTTPHIDELLTRGVADIVVERELRALLAQGDLLRLKMGFDPSRADLHLGYAVALRKLRAFQELGHQVVLIVGDWTARIGDPTGRSETRVMLTEEQVNANAQSYMRQFFRIVDKDKTQVVWQSEWFGRFNLADVVKLTAKFTVAQMLAREDFAQRYASQRPIALVEFLYPLLQGYDSVAIRSDVEFGGSDQKFNCLVGRDLQGMEGMRPQQVFLVPLLLGTDGRKMSQSYGNYIGFEDLPNEMYGKVMSIPDNLMSDYFELLTDVPLVDLVEIRDQLRTGAGNPMELKHRLAREIVTEFHSAEAAREGEAYFRRVVQERALPDDIPVRRLADFAGSLSVQVSSTVPGEDTVVGQQLPFVDLTKLLVEIGFAESRSEVRRLLQQNAVTVINPRLEERTVTAGNVAIAPGSVVRVGKRRFVKLV